MRGEPIEAVRVGIDSMISAMRQDPYALESVYLCIISFDREVKLLLPLTSLRDLQQLPKIETPESGPTHLGAALQMLAQTMDAEVHKQTATEKGDWRPLIFVMTDGKPSDLQLYGQMAAELRSRNLGGIVACAAGPKSDVAPLRQLTDAVYAIDGLDQSSFMQFFQWVSASIGTNNRQLGTNATFTLPPPPAGVNVVI